MWTRLHVSRYKERKKNYKKTKKNAKNRSKKALAKKNQNIKQTMKKDSKICQKQHKKNKIFKKKGFTHLPLLRGVSIFTNNNENWWTPDRREVFHYLIAAAPRGTYSMSVRFPCWLTERFVK